MTGNLKLLPEALRFQRQQKQQQRQQQQGLIRNDKNTEQLLHIRFSEGKKFASLEMD